MVLKVLAGEFSVCRLKEMPAVEMLGDFCFLGKTDEEISLVCPLEAVPADVPVREDGWRAFRIEGVLDFSLIGILAQISAVLAAAKIGIFAVSTYNTDYILTKAEDFDAALAALAKDGYEISRGDQ